MTFTEPVAVAVDGGTPLPRSAMEAVQAFSSTALVHAITVQGSSTTCTVFAAGFDGWLPVMSADGVVFQSAFGQLSLTGLGTAFPSPISVNATLGVPTGWHLAATISGTLASAGAPISNATVAKTELDAPTGQQKPGNSGTAISSISTVGDLCNALQSAFASQTFTAPLSSGISTIKLSDITVSCANQSANATATVELPYLSSSLSMSLAFEAIGRTLLTPVAGTTASVTLTGGDFQVHVSSFELPSNAAATPNLYGTVEFNDTGVFPKKTPDGLIGLSVSDSGVSLISPISMPVAQTATKESAGTITLDQLTCHSNTCTGTVEFSAADLPYPVDLQYQDGQITGDASIPLGDGYIVSAKKVKWTAGAHTISADAVTLSGPLLSSATINNFALKFATPSDSDQQTELSGSFTTGTLIASRLITVDSLAGSISRQNLSLTVTGCVKAGVPSCNPSTTDTDASWFFAHFAGTKIMIPFDGAKPTFDGNAIAADGSVLGRRIVKSCPSLTSKGKNADLFSTENENLQVTLGLHLIPGSTSLGDIVCLQFGFANTAATMHTPAPPASTALDSGLNATPIANAQSQSKTPPVLHVSQPKAAATGSVPKDFRFPDVPELRTVALSYANTDSPLAVKMGSRRLAITKLDLEYDSTSKPVISDYAVNQALYCETALEGNVELTASSIVGGSVSHGSTSASSTPESMSVDLGIGRDCVYADFDGSVSVGMGNDASMVVTATHFGRGPFDLDYLKAHNVKYDSQVETAYNTYVSVDGSLYVKQVSLAVKHVGVYTDVRNAHVRVSGSVDVGQTVFQNLPLLISNAFTALVGIFHR